MQILKIPFISNYKFNSNQDEKMSNRYFSNPVSANKLQILPFQNFNAYPKISFSGNVKSNVSKLQSAGYEIAIIENEKLVNKGKNIILKNVQDVVALSKTPAAWNKNFVLAADIDLKDAQFDGIGNLKQYFSGEFDGNGHVIKNLNINKGEFNRVGFFRTCDNASIKNLSFENALVKGKNEVGGIVGSAENGTVIENVKYSGDINAKNVAGGIVGYSKNTTFNNCTFYGNLVDICPNKNIPEEDSIFITKPRKDIVQDNMFFGGITGIGENVRINAANVNAKISSDSIVGGIVGQANWVDLSNSVFQGEIKTSKNAGSLAGIAKASYFSSSYSFDEHPFLGNNHNSKVQECFSDITFCNEDTFLNWDKSIWNISPKKLPRLKSALDEYSAEQIFIEDINNDIKNKNIKIGLNYTPPKNISLKLSDMEPPKHYAENEKIVNEINNCTDSSRLAYLFAYWTDGFRWDFNSEDKKHDEILLALVKNKHFDINARWNDIASVSIFSSFEEATFCTPFYVLSCLNKGYIFNEMLKRDDINPFVSSGNSFSTLTAFDGLFRYPIVTNMFLLFNSKNPKIKDYVDKMVVKYSGRQSSDRLVNLLCKNSFNKFGYNEETNEVIIPTYLIDELKDSEEINIEGKKDYSSLWEVANSPDIPGNYVDSLGNNILHIIADKQANNLEQLTLFNLAVNNGANVNLKNKKGKTPFKIVLENKNDFLGSFMVQANINDMFDTDKDSNNLLLINVKYNNTTKAPLLLDNIHNRGFSLNTCDKYASTPLIEAIKSKNIKKINYLLTNGAAVDLCDENGQTALHHAFINHDVNTIKMLMDSFCCLEVKDKMGLTPMDYWPECSQNEAFARLNWDSALVTYHFAGIEDIDSKSLNVADINTLAKELANVKSFDVDKLKFRGIELEKSLIRLFYYLCNNNLNSQEAGEILYQLVQTNNPYTKECLIKLLKMQSIDINKPNKNGETPLILALKSYQNAKTNKEKLSNMQIVKCLLDFGADVDIADANKQTALHQAVFSNNIVLFNEILGKHPNVNYTDINGYNPIQYLSEEKEDPMCKVYNVYAQKRNLNK